MRRKTSHSRDPAVEWPDVREPRRPRARAFAAGAEDFVVKLTDARARAATTLADYVPTVAVIERMNDALGRIDASFKQRKSLATYLHSSFGSGKSHFMAVLTLLLEGAPEAFRKEPWRP